MRTILGDLSLECRQQLVELLEETTEVGTWDWDIVANIFSWSPRQFSHFGLAPIPTGTITYELWLSAIHPKDRQRVQAAIAETIASGSPLDLTFRVMWRDHDGGSIDVHWLRSRGRLIRGTDGVPVRMLGTSRDVTEMEKRNALDRAKQESELADLFAGPSRFDILFSESEDCLAQLQVHGEDRFTYQMINPAGLKQIGMTMAAAQGLTPVDVLGRSNGQKMLAALSDVVRTGLPIHYEPTFDYDGTRVTYDAIYIPLRDDTGSITGILCRARDVTEQRRMAQALQQVQKMEALGLMASGVAHDFNNMLTALRGCFMRVAKLVDSQEVDNLLNLGQRSLEQGEALTRRLLAFARKEDVASHRISLNTSIADAVPLLRTAVPDVEFFTQLGSPDQKVVADSALLHSCLLNLAINARDAKPNGCRIFIKSLVVHEGDRLPASLLPGRYAVVSFADNGPGMSEAVLARAMEPFYTTKENGRGTGLGLSMVYGTIRSFGGTVTIDAAVDTGTVVQLFLPIAGNYVAPTIS